MLPECHAHNGPRSSDLTVFDALAHLQPKALLIASEILWLLEGGYADAALARWRTLHEVVVTAMFIAKNGPETARDYRYSEVFASQRDASEVNSHAKRANLQRFTEVEMNKMDSDCKVAEASIGRKLTNDFDWASPALKRSGETERATFKNIEKSVGMDHWRPRYRRACQHIHAGFTHPQSLLGMAEAKI